MLTFAYFNKTKWVVTQIFTEPGWALLAANMVDHSTVLHNNNYIHTLKYGIPIDSSDSLLMDTFFCNPNKKSNFWTTITFWVCLKGFSHKKIALP